MPSSRRPSCSTNPLLQPSWHEKHKKYAPVSISLVFAEPEQGAPLASASQVIVSTQLDTVSVQSSDDTSILSQRLTCRQSLSSLDLQRPVEEVRQPHQQETSSASITLQYEEEPPSTLFFVISSQFKMKCGFPQAVSVSMCQSRQKVSRKLPQTTQST